MNRDQNIKKLVANGKTGELVAAADRIGERARSNYAAIISDDRLSDSARRSELAKAFVEFDAELGQEIKAQADLTFSMDRDDASRVFGTKGLDGDPASLTISMRDAADRVDSVESQAELKRLLEQATRTGDEVLARATVRKAVEERYHEVVNTFTAARPNLLEATERLWHQQEAEGTPFAFTMARMGMIPPGFEGVGFTELAAAAE